MLERDLLPDFSAEALVQLATIQEPAGADSEMIRDQRDLLWASIDNDDSLDLDQLTVAETMPGGKVKITGCRGRRGLTCQRRLGD